MDSSAGSFFGTADDAFLKNDTFFEDSFADTVDPVNLQKTTNLLLEDLQNSSNNSNSNYYNELTAHDSGVDLRAQWNLSSPKEDAVSIDPYDQFINMGGSPTLETNTPSSSTDMIFSSQGNSPGDFKPDFKRDPSSVGSPDAPPATLFKSESDVSEPKLFETAPYEGTEAILIPQSRPVPKVILIPDKTKTRAETQIKITLTLDPLENVEFIRFPRKTLAKPKHFASEDEKQEYESSHGILHMNVHLVCATAIETPENRTLALRRAAGELATPRRVLDGTPLNELPKDHETHPQNGGEVLICEGCKERERKRYDRKKKRGEDEEEFSKYEDDRVVMINEKEYKKFKDIESGDMQFSPQAKQVEFAMRIACYCRHQEEKSPMGYQVIFTFSCGREVLVQHVSDVFHITDDHKNKELSTDLTQRIAVPPYGVHQQYIPQSNVVVPVYQYPETYSNGMGAYSQPTTPIISSQYTSPISPMGHTFPQTAVPAMAQSMPTLSQPTPALSHQVRQPAQAFPATSAATSVTTFARHQRGQSYLDNSLATGSQMQFETHGLPRPQSMDNFSFSYHPNDMHFASQQNHYFNSAPPSAGGTPINLSRPASPTWEQGPQKKGKTIRRS